MSSKKNLVVAVVLLQPLQQGVHGFLKILICIIQPYRINTSNHSQLSCSWKSVGLIETICCFPEMSDLSVSVKPCTVRLQKITNKTGVSRTQ